MTTTTAVFDASVFVRALADGHATARQWLRDARDGDVAVYVPDLVFAEVANALLTRARVRDLPPKGVLRRLALLDRVPLRCEPIRQLAPAATRAALAHGLTAYDGCYLALAEACRAVLVTADRRLAEAATRAELLA